MTVPAPLLEWELYRRYQVKCPNPVTADWWRDGRRVSSKITCIAIAERREVLEVVGCFAKSVMNSACMTYTVYTFDLGIFNVWKLNSEFASHSLIAKRFSA